MEFVRNLCDQSRTLSTPVLPISVSPCISGLKYWWSWGGSNPLPHDCQYQGHAHNHPLFLNNSTIARTLSLLGMASLRLSVPVWEKICAKFVRFPVCPRLRGPSLAPVSAFDGDDHLAVHSTPRGKNATTQVLEGTQDGCIHRQAELCAESEVERGNVHQDHGLCPATCPHDIHAGGSRPGRSRPSCV